jgi:hypothetical protein
MCIRHGVQTSFVKMNGKRGEKFKMDRAVWQGCPIALYLYLFIADVLGYMILDPPYKIEKLVLPNG